MSRVPPREAPPSSSKSQDVYEKHLSGGTSYTQWTQYTGETGTHDIHTMLALSDFPAPPTTIPTPTTAASAASAFPKTPTRPVPSSRSHSSRASHISSTTNQEEILQDYFIASLLNSHVPSPGAHQPPTSGGNPWPDSPVTYADSPTRVASRPSVDQRLRYVPTSPTLSAHTHAPSVPALPPLSPPPPVPPIPSPLQAYFEHTVRDPSPLQTVPPIAAGDAAASESNFSQTSYATGSLTTRSHNTTIVRVSAQDVPPLPPTPGSTTVLGYARAAYIPKSAVASTPPPSIIPTSYSASNLIDLNSPNPPRSPNKALISPRVSNFPNLTVPDSPVHDTLGPLPGPSRFRSLTPSPRSEFPPPNVPEDITSSDDPGPSTSYFDRSTAKQRNRISMSSLFSKFSRSTSISSKQSRWRSRKSYNQKELPPLPPLPKRQTLDPEELGKQEAEMNLPALMRRAGFLAQILDSGRLPSRNSVSTYRHVPPSSPLPQGSSSGSWVNSASAIPSDTPPLPSPWEYSSGSGYIDETAVRNRKSQSIRSFFTRGTTTDRSGHFNVLDEELQQRYMEHLANQSRSAHSGSNGFPPGSIPSGVAVESLPSSEKARRIAFVDQPPPTRSLRSVPPPWKWKKRTIFAVFVNIALVVAVIVTVVSVASSHSSRGSLSSSTSSSNCSGNFTGTNCALDATCVCTSKGTTACNPLAVAISSVLPQTNKLMNTSYTDASVALTLWDTEGSPVGGNCAAQAVLIDTNPKNADDTHAQWARSAVLWSVLESQDLVAAKALRTFVNAMDYGYSVSAVKRSSNFTTQSAGFVFDFVAMTITAPEVTWKEDANPPDAQTELVDDALESVLDRYYTSASALSTQATTALQNYWTKELQLDSSKLPSFISAFQSSPILLPFDMSLSSNGQSLTTVMQLHDPKTISFPPSQGCNPMMTDAQIKVLNSVEQTAFGLSPVSPAPTTFDINCFRNRPVYGVLDVMRLRLPFLDSTKSAPLQAAVLGSDAASRVLVRSGLALSAYPSSSSPSDVPKAALVAENYGTMKHLSHVILQYLKALPAVQAAALATFILSASPPPSSSLLSATNSSATLQSVPVVEVALFGGFGSVDVDHSISSMSTPSGAMFFGSANGDVFRSWARNAGESSDEAIVWTNSSLAAQVVREKPGTDSTFEAIWDAAGTMISNAYTVGTTTTAKDVQTVVGVLQQDGYMAP